MKADLILKNYEIAKERYAALGVDTDKAIETLKKAAEMADSRADGGVNLSVAPLALLKAGQLLESKNKKAEALEVYKSIKQKYVASPLYQEIDKYIERASR